MLLSSGAKYCPGRQGLLKVVTLCCGEDRNLSPWGWGFSAIARILNVLKVVRTCNIRKRFPLALCAISNTHAIPYCWHTDIYEHHHGCRTARKLVPRTLITIYIRKIMLDFAARSRHTASLVLEKRDRRRSGLSSSQCVSFITLRESPRRYSVLGGMALEDSMRSLTDWVSWENERIILLNLPN